MQMISNCQDDCLLTITAKHLEIQTEVEDYLLQCRVVTELTVSLHVASQLRLLFPCLTSGTANINSGDYQCTVSTLLMFP